MQTGTASIRFERPPRILQAASVVGPKEAEGPFGALFDEIDPDGKCGQDNWEQAESELQKRAVKKVIEKAHLLPKLISLVKTSHPTPEMHLSCKDLQNVPNVFGTSVWKHWKKKEPITVFAH